MVYVGIVGTAAGLMLCLVMMRDIRRSRTSLTPFEAQMLALGRAAERAAAHVGQFLIPRLREMARAVNEAFDWAVDAGLVDPPKDDP